VSDIILTTVVTLPCYRSTKTTFQQRSVACKLFLCEITYQSKYKV